MDKTVPAGAASLLDFIAAREAPQGYGTVYGNNQAKLAIPLVQMTIADVIASGQSWTNLYGSSACGRYQFMKATLQGLVKELGLTGRERFTPDLQDRLAYQLLKRRGYAAYVAGGISRTAFGLRIAQEWASFPVLAATQGAHRAVARGETYYAGDKINKALVAPAAVEAALDVALRVAKGGPPPVPAPSAPIAGSTPALKPAPTGGLLRSGAQATGGAVRSGLAGLYDLIHNALARKA